MSRKLEFKHNIIQIQTTMMNLADAPVDEDFVEEVERLDNNEGCEFAAWTQYINGIDNLLHDKCSYMKQITNISRIEADLLFNLGPVFRIVIESTIRPDFGENQNMAQNRYEWKARNFLRDYDYILEKYYDIFNDNNNPDFIRYEVDEDFVSDWHYRIYPDMEWGDDSWYRWSWNDDGWIMCSCEGE